MLSTTKQKSRPRLLILTQTVDQADPVLGFFHEWIREFAKHCEKVTVICLREGEHDLPENVSVYSLGKEKGVSRIKYLFRFYKYIWSLWRDYDVVFVHMNPEYIVLGGFWWRLWGKTVGLWRVHGSVTPTVRIATLLTNIVFTTSPESFRLKSPKVHIMGHGIPVERFAWKDTKEAKKETRILTVGRVSQTKRVHEMLLALDELHRRGIHFSFTIVGIPATEADVAYQDILNREIAKRPYQISMAGAVPHDDLPRMLAQADVFLNLSATQSMDKAVLESLAAGVPVVSSNKAFQSVLEQYGLYCADNAPATIADAIEAYLKRNNHETIRTALRLYVENRHSLSRLIPAILQVYKSMGETARIPD